MADPSDLLDRGTPDALSTADLAPGLAAEIDNLAGRWSPWIAEDPTVHWGVRARALVVAGRYDQARELVAARLDEPWSIQGLAAATWASGRVGPAAAVTRLAATVRKIDGEFLLHGDVPLMPVSQLRGLVAAAQGELDVAADELRTAADQGDVRAPVWGALARYELARVLRCRSELRPSGDDGRAFRSVLAAAQTFFVASGCEHLRRRCDSLLGPPRPVDAALAGLGHLVEGATWTVGFGVAPPVEVPPSKGLVALAYVIRHRDRGVAAVELDSVLDGRVPHPLVVAHARTVDTDVTTAELRAHLFDDVARSRVTKLIRRTIAGLGSAHPLLAEHLQRCVATGFACRYDADPELRWRL